jgi:uncharacterized protein YndB with AHSA1/START domain
MPAIRRHILIATSTRAVWNAISTPEGLCRWLVAEARLEPRSGGRVVLARIGADGLREEARGMVHKWRPTSHLEIAFDRLGDHPSRGSLVAFQVARDGDETRLSVVQSGGEQLEDEAAAASLDDRWRKDLERLQAALDEGPPPKERR